jgi:transposase InsO family protein
MQQLGIRGAVRGKVVKTTIPDTAAPSPRDKVNRVFRAPAPNLLWDEPFVRYWSEDNGRMILPTSRHGRV